MTELSLEVCICMFVYFRLHGEEMSTMCLHRKTNMLSNTVAVSRVYDKMRVIIEHMRAVIYLLLMQQQWVRGNKKTFPVNITAFCSWCIQWCRDVFRHSIIWDSWQIGFLCEELCYTCIYWIYFTSLVICVLGRRLTRSSLDNSRGSQLAFRNIAEPSSQIFTPLPRSNLAAQSGFRAETFSDSHTVITHPLLYVDFNP